MHISETSKIEGPHCAFRGNRSTGNQHKQCLAHLVPEQLSNRISVLEISFLHISRLRQEYANMVRLEWASAVAALELQAMELN